MDPIPGGSSYEDIYISRRSLIAYYNDCNESNNEEKINFLFEKVKSSLKVDNLSLDIQSMLRRLISKYKMKLQVAHRNRTRCHQKNKDWLDFNLAFPVSREARSSSEHSKSLGGRPSKEFDQCSERSKRRKTETIRQTLRPAELAFAAQVEYRASGEIEKSRAIKQIVEGTVHHLSLSEDKALSLLIEANLTKFQYNTMRESAKEMGCNLYPNYEAVLSAKKNCYPENIYTSETECKVDLQDLLDHTVRRLCLSLSEVLASLEDKNILKHLCLVSKWGCDGSGSHSIYKQVFRTEDASDENMLITSLVPVQLIASVPGKSVPIVIWQNPRTSSPRSCRPKKLQFAKENITSSKSEFDEMQFQINALVPTAVNLTETVHIKHKMLMTMVDGKMINSITDTKSTQRCYLCGLTIKDFNKINLCIHTSIKEENLEYGISSLHAWIRFAEFILHLAYKMKICKWQSRKSSDKIKEQLEKKRIQHEFRTKLGIRVDEPKNIGGTSTDGNTARKMFENENTTAEITGINVNLIKKMHIILQVISSGYKIKLPIFEKLCKKTAASIVHSYPWYNMPTTVHKILIHGPSIVDYSDLAIGLLSEDAQESRNKDVRRYREQYARKFTREQNLLDIFHRLLCSSDPLITYSRKLVPKKNLKFHDSVMAYFEEPDLE